MNVADLKLGKLAPRHDARSLKLADYLHRPELPPPPRDIDWRRGFHAWSMFGNDRAGCCAFASLGHGIQGWTHAANGTAAPLTEADVIGAYAACTGYDPATGEDDNGTVELDALKYMRKVGMGGHRIGAHVLVDPHNTWEVKVALHLFGGLYTGVALPESAKAQVARHKRWSVVDPSLHGSSEPGGWGGHAMWLIAANGERLILPTWASEQEASWAWVDAYCDELHAILSPDWVSPEKKAPNGFDLAALQRDLAAVTA